MLNKRALPTGDHYLPFDPSNVLECTDDSDQDVRPACRNVGQFAISQPIDTDKKHACPRILGEPAPLTTGVQSLNVMRADANRTESSMAQWKERSDPAVGYVS